MQGFFVPFLVGGISLVVLAIGSTNPGALGFLIDQFSLVFPDYRERVRRHEAAHFLVSHPRQDVGGGWPACMPCRPHALA